MQRQNFKSNYRCKLNCKNKLKLEIRNRNNLMKIAINYFVIMEEYTEKAALNNSRRNNIFQLLESYLDIFFVHSGRTLLEGCRIYVAVNWNKDTNRLRYNPPLLLHGFSFTSVLQPSLVSSNLAD